MPKKIRRQTEIEPPAASDIEQWVKQFLALKEQDKLVTERLGSVKRTLSEIVEEFGYESEGSFYFDLGHEVDGVVRLKREQRVREELNEGKAYEVLREKGLLERCTETVTSLVQGEIAACVLEGLITEPEYDVIIEKKVSYAFIPQKA